MNELGSWNSEKLGGWTIALEEISGILRFVRVTRATFRNNIGELATNPNHIHYRRTL
jgi:hypothetical protein